MSPIGNNSFLKLNHRVGHGPVHPESIIGRFVILVGHGPISHESVIGRCVLVDHRPVSLESVIRMVCHMNRSQDGFSVGHGPTGHAVGHRPVMQLAIGRSVMSRS